MLDLKIGIVSVNTEKIFIGSVPRSDLIQIFQSRVDIVFRNKHYDCLPQIVCDKFRPIRVHYFRVE